MTTSEIEIRCPIGPQRLFAIMIAKGEKLKVVEGNLIEFSCDNCKKLQRQQRDVFRVLHRYDLAGEFVETVVVENG